MEHLHFSIEKSRTLVEHYMHLRDTAGAKRNGNGNGHGAQDAMNTALGDALESIRPLVRLIAPRYTPQADLEDVEQDILLHLSGVLPMFNRNPRDLNAFLVAVIRNKSISLWRQRNVRIDGDDIDKYYDLPEPDEPEESEEEIEASVEAFTAIVYGWLKIRFPSIPSRRTQKTAEILATGLLDNSPVTHIKAHLIGLLGDEMRPSQIGTIYDSVNIFLRAISFNPAYVIKTLPLDEFTLIAELELILGERQARLLYTMFKGCYLRFRNNP